ncbi:MAG: hypothetical protein V1748_02915 [Actinomycetota bacterium]
MARMSRWSSQDRLCIVCGHSLGPWGRVCDKCGSIQRPSKGDGLAIPIEAAGLCEVCGVDLPEDYEGTICEACLAESAPRPVIWIEDLPTYQRAKRVSAGVSLVSGAALVSSIVLVFVVGAAAWVIIMMVASAAGAGAGGAAYAVYARKPTGEIQHLEGVKPESPLQQIGKKG